REDQTGMYRVNFKKMQKAMDALSEKILVLQGNGDIEGVQQLMNDMGMIGEDLQKDLNRLEQAGIPVDIVFEQGVEVLGLK
ncbi:MAG: putative DNA-binding transcriptional regulator YafY, partial [Flavobacteriales bacterium]